VLACLPPAVARQLGMFVLQYMNLIAQEVAAYAPAFAHGAGGYQPHMGVSPEVETMADSLFTGAQLDAWNAEGWE
jgi:hypothetical protein